MIENEKIAEWIDRYNRNDLHGKELEEFLEMMKKDPELRKEVNLDKDLNNLFLEPDVIDLRRKLRKHRVPDPSKGINYPLILMAASVTILLTLAVFFFFMIRSDDQSIIPERDYTYYPADTLRFRDSGTMENIYSNLTLPKDDHKEIVKLESELRAMREDFDPYLPYESLVEEVHRSNGFRLITPAKQSVFTKGEIIDFTWKPVARPVTVIILTNRTKEVLRSELLLTGKLSVSTKDLKPGLYYVKFISNEEIVFFSKFTLN